MYSSDQAANRQAPNSSEIHDETCSIINTYRYSTDNCNSIHHIGKDNSNSVLLVFVSHELITLTLNTLTTVTTYPVIANGWRSVIKVGDVGNIVKRRVVGRVRDGIFRGKKGSECKTSCNYTEKKNVDDAVRNGQPLVSIEVVVDTLVCVN